MEKNVIFFNKIFERIYGGYFGLLYLGLYAGSIFIGFIITPGMNMTNHFISDLSVAPGLAAPIFTCGFVSGGIFSIPYYIFLALYLQNESLDEKYRNFLIILAIIYGTTLTLIGIFPFDRHTFRTVFHDSFAYMHFIVGAIIFFICSTCMWLNKKIPRIQTFISTSGLIIYIIFLFLYAPLRWIFYEWLTFFTVIFWVLESSIFTLIEKKIFNFKKI